MVGEQDLVSAIPGEVIEGIMEDAIEEQRSVGYLPLEICGNDVDDDLNGEIDFDDAACQFPDEPGAPLAPETAQRLQLTASAAQGGEPCTVTVSVLRAEIFIDNESGDDEYFFDVVALGVRTRHPKTGTYVVPANSTLPYTIQINNHAATKVIGTKDHLVPVAITVATHEEDDHFDDVGVGAATPVLPCPSSGAGSILTYSYFLDIDAKVWFSIVLDP